MKKNLFFCLAISGILILSGCTKDKDNDSLKGLVSFASGPSYIDGKLNFKAQIQYGAVGKPVDIEYLILDGTDVIKTGSANAGDNPDGMGIWYETEQISINLPASEYSGLIITVWLDPDNKITGPEYTTDTSVELWKKDSAEIP